LHHFIERAQDPALTYDVENVTPLCVAVHAKISRGNLSVDQQRLYAEATLAWQSAGKGRRTVAFADVMESLHRDVYG
jgi:hypothetical protein